MQMLYIDDATQALRRQAAGSVQLFVTSPPYWTLKDYQHPRQIGHQESYETYLARLAEVWSECKRVLEPGCRMAINVGDQFLRARDHGEYALAPIHADIIQQITQLGGFIYLGGIIWRKITTTKTTGGCSWMGSIYLPRDGYVTFEHEFVLLFKKRGRARRPGKEVLDKSRLTKEQRSLWFRGVWDITPTRQDAHPAAFPVELPERLIRMFTFHGETVFDPFAGSGTTLVAAERSGRSGIGAELNPVYAEAAATRVKGLGVVNEQERPPIEPHRESAQPQQPARARTRRGLDLAASPAK